MILGKGLHFVFSRLGWEGGLLVAGLITVIDYDTRGVVHMIVPSGAPGHSEANVNQGQALPALPLDPHENEPDLTLRLGPPGAEAAAMTEGRNLEKQIHALVLAQVRKSYERRRNLSQMGDFYQRVAGKICESLVRR
jgi:hypothetical protein